MRSTKKTDWISKFYGSFYIYYLLTTPGSFELNLRTPSLEKNASRGKTWIFKELYSRPNTFKYHLMYKRIVSDRT